MISQLKNCFLKSTKQINCLTRVEMFTYTTFILFLIEIVSQGTTRSHARLTSAVDGLKFGCSKGPGNEIRIRGLWRRWFRYEAPALYGRTEEYRRLLTGRLWCWRTSRRRVFPELGSCRPQSIGKKPACSNHGFHVSLLSSIKYVCLL